MQTETRLFFYHKLIYTLKRHEMTTKHKRIQQKFKSDYDNYIRRKKKLQQEAIRKLFK